MFIIFGSRYYFRTTGQGTFLCPQCQTSQPYRYRRGRRFIHVFFIPLIPISGATEHVKCGGCKTRFRTSVLAQTAAA
ncbi:MAG: zinc-ribbon domain-containing protein [Actinobacteria bacterium]|nr:zinc-ribbon domain-containing protein [Actinomycetota bacterium]